MWKSKKDCQANASRCRLLFTTSWAVIVLLVHLPLGELQTTSIPTSPVTTATTTTVTTTYYTTTPPEPNWLVKIALKVTDMSSKRKREWKRVGDSILDHISFVTSRFHVKAQNYLNLARANLMGLRRAKLDRRTIVSRTENSTDQDQILVDKDRGSPWVQRTVENTRTSASAGTTDVQKGDYTTRQDQVSYSAHEVNTALEKHNDIKKAQETSTLHT
ncbi:uncharacterized protein LOC128679229 [Plodia interpunctella]|uniref:uncharacterized protein LOC128679229 n=1 Tax=Plodia interpunctella TaxID=58824 RepID=UPI002368581B|nr:uncharacterized protein LOC128679229 [Plodia interpunctella]XP_053617301.1 uncharacterized protein LOC128679229 [Plodia interpunctella]XP_053617302.1 uncharacterized protein LOC128679229 [Plodia interpunctella]